MKILKYLYNKHPVDRCFVQNDCKAVSNYYNIPYSDSILQKGKFYCPTKNSRCVIQRNSDIDCPTAKPVCGPFLKYETIRYVLFQMIF